MFSAIKKENRYLACFLLLRKSFKWRVEMTAIKNICCEIKSLFTKLIGSEWISYDEFWSRALKKRELIRS